MYRTGTCDISTRKNVAERLGKDYFCYLLGVAFSFTPYAFKEASMKRTVALGILIVTTLLLLSGCNTIRGAGEDIEQGGQAIQRSAD